MKRILVIISFCILLNPSTNYGANYPLNELQNNPRAIAELQIGDKMPDILLSELVNSSRSSTMLSHYTGGKFLIIDFFGTWCVPCVKALPILDQFQKKYQNKLNILAITDEKRATVTNFLATNSNMKSIGLTFMTGDKTFEKMFPHKEVPHEIWIDRNGIIKAITSGEMITDENVADFVNGRLKELQVKKYMMDYDTQVALFKNGNGGDGNEYLSRSILTKAMEGADSPIKYELDSNHNIKRILVMNRPPLQMFNTAYSHLQFQVNSKRIVFSTKDSTQMIKIGQMGNQTEYYKYCYCYEYIPLHPDKADVVFKNMLEDLNRYFSVYGIIEKKEIPCWVLVRTNQNDSLLHSSGGKKMIKSDGTFRNFPLSNLVQVLNRFHDIEPVVDETHFSQPVDMDLNFSSDIPHLNEYPDIELIRTNLKRYGLDLVKQNRSVDVLVIKDK